MTTCCSRLVNHLSSAVISPAFCYRPRRITECDRMSATSVSAAGNYIPGVRNRKTRRFRRLREILPDEGEKENQREIGKTKKRENVRERERGWGEGKDKKRNAKDTETRGERRRMVRQRTTTSRQVVVEPRRGETGEQSHYQGNPA